MKLNVAKGMRQFADALASRTLHADGAVTIAAMKGTGAGAVVVFTSLNGNFAKGGRREFAGSASQNGARTCIFVQDMQQHWFQDPGVAERIVDVVGSYLAAQGIARLMLVGDSMGAYAAMALARDLRADTVLAFGPQLDPDPAAIPLDDRWLDLRGDIAAFTLGSVADRLSVQTRYYVVHGRIGPDIVQWSRFPQAPNLHHYIVSGVGHPVGTEMKTRGVLTALFEAAFDDRPAAFRKIMNANDGYRRKPGEGFATRPNDWYRQNIAPDTAVAAQAGDSAP